CQVRCLQYLGAAAHIGGVHSVTHTRREGVESSHVNKITAAHHVLDQLSSALDIPPYRGTALKWGQWPGTWTHQRAHAILSRQQCTKYVAPHKSAGSGQEDK